MPFEPGEVISYLAMCEEEGTSLQRGMNFQLGPNHSVLLMSQRPNAPYADEVRDGGTVIIYEGHDAPHGDDTPDPKAIDQPLRTATGRLTQNGRFFEAARTKHELVRVYEKLLQGVWVCNGVFLLTDAWMKPSGGRLVCKFRLEITGETDGERETQQREPSRIIPSAVKREVWARDGGRCVLCGASDELHFDHEIPFSKGGASTTPNVRILCARHNLRKGARIE